MKKEILKHTFQTSICSICLDIQCSRFTERWIMLEPKCLGLKFVWNRLAIPKHRFCAWLAFRLRLQTKFRLKTIGVCDIDSCLFCNSEPETHEHLFFQCQLSSQILLRQWLQLYGGQDKYFSFTKRVAEEEGLFLISKKCYECCLYCCNVLYLAG